MILFGTYTLYIHIYYISHFTYIYMCVYTSTYICQSQTVYVSPPIYVQTNIFI